jgi:VIT1/CCC1 family predicted Fe2+/Mn2+ transporter
MNKELIREATSAQKGEITGYKIYLKLSKKADKRNKQILQKIAKDELKHYNFWKSITKKEIKENKFKVFIYSLLASIFGLSFSLKLMERGEISDYYFYSRLKNKFPVVKSIIKDEQKHEKDLINLLSDERLKYASSIVLGLNDALVELTGALTGFTLALKHSTIIAVAGLITGIAASLSMAASGYLSTKEDPYQKKPLVSAFYTGIAYLITVILLITPYLIFKNVYAALVIMLITGIFVIAFYTFYISTAKSLKFWPRFREMLFISLSIAFISFLIGLLIRKYIIF